MEPSGIQIAGALGGLGFPEILVIALVAILLFGGKKVGDLGKGLGEGIRNFKTALKSEDEKDAKVEEKKKE
jgi:sec-independent protein translocase protein TatA